MVSFEISDCLLSRVRVYGAWRTGRCQMRRAYERYRLISNSIIHSVDFAFQRPVCDHDGHCQLKPLIFSVLENLVLENFLLAAIPHASPHSAFSFRSG